MRGDAHAHVRVDSPHVAVYSILRLVYTFAMPRTQRKVRRRRVVRRTRRPRRARQPRMPRRTRRRTRRRLSGRRLRARRTRRGAASLGGGGFAKRGGGVQRGGGDKLTIEDAYHILKEDSVFNKPEFNVEFDNSRKLKEIKKLRIEYINEKNEYIKDKILEEFLHIKTLQQDVIQKIQEDDDDRGKILFKAINNGKYDFKQIKTGYEEKLENLKDSLQEISIFSNAIIRRNKTNIGFRFVKEIFDKKMLKITDDVSKNIRQKNIKYLMFNVSKDSLKKAISDLVDEVYPESDRPTVDVGPEVAENGKKAHCIASEISQLRGLVACSMAKNGEAEKRLELFQNRLASRGDIDDTPFREALGRPSRAAEGARGSAYAGVGSENENDDDIESETSSASNISTPRNTPTDTLRSMDSHQERRDEAQRRREQGEMSYLNPRYEAPEEHGIRVDEQIKQALAKLEASRGESSSSQAQVRHDILPDVDEQLESDPRFRQPAVTFAGPVGRRNQNSTRVLRYR